MNGVLPSLDVASALSKRRATASALLLAAEKVGATETSIPFLWKVEHIATDPSGRRFALYIIPEQDCRCFLFHASFAGSAEVLYECAVKANVPIRLPPSKDLIWDGEVGSLLVIVTAGIQSFDRSQKGDLPDRPELSPRRGEEEYHASDMPLALDSKALGLV